MTKYNNLLEWFHTDSIFVAPAGDGLEFVEVLKRNIRSVHRLRKLHLRKVAKCMLCLGSTRRFLVDLLRSVGASVSIDPPHPWSHVAPVRNDSDSLSSASIKSFLPSQFLSDAVVNAFIKLLPTRTVSVLHSHFFYHLVKHTHQTMITWPSLTDDTLRDCEFLAIPMKNFNHLNCGVAVVKKNSGIVRIFDTQVRARNFQAVFPKVLRFANALGLKYNELGWSPIHSIEEQVQIDYTSYSVVDAEALMLYELYLLCCNSSTERSTTLDTNVLHAWIRLYLQSGSLVELSEVPGLIDGASNVKLNKDSIINYYMIILNKSRGFEKYQTLSRKNSPVIV